MLPNEQASATWEDYFATYWWVFAATCVIGIIAIGVLYFEHVSGRHLVEWCSATCTMLGALLVALLIILTHSRLGKRTVDSATVQHSSQIEERLQTLEELAEPIDNNVLFLDDFKSKGPPK